MISRRLARPDLSLLLSAPVLRLYQKSYEVEEIAERIYGADETPDYGRIRCPHCRWRPRASSRWRCSDCGYPEYFQDGCGAEWNTFDTRGRCPGCGHQWRWTACLECYRWSPHEDWYERAED